MTGKVVSGARACSLPPHQIARQAWLRRRRMVSAALATKSLWSSGHEAFDTGEFCARVPAPQRQVLPCKAPDTLESHPRRFPTP